MTDDELTNSGDRQLPHDEELETDGDRRASPHDVTAQPGAWLDRLAASKFLDISPRTMDRHIARGLYQKRTTRGGRIEYSIPGAPPELASQADEMAITTLATDDPELSIIVAERLSLAHARQIAPLVDLVERQQTVIAEQAERIGQLQAELEAAKLLNGAIAPHDSRPWWRRLLLGE